MHTGGWAMEVTWHRDRLCWLLVTFFPGVLVHELGGPASGHGIRAVQGPSDSRREGG